MSNQGIEEPVKQTEIVQEEECISEEYDFVGDQISSYESYVNDFQIPINISTTNATNEEKNIEYKWLTLFKSTQNDSKPDLKLPFNKDHFIHAMTNVIKHPNINSTVILRADILVEIDPECDEKDGDDKRVYTKNEELINTDFSNDPNIKYETINIGDIKFKDISHNNKEWKLLKGYIRRIIPRNPSKDAIINQSCLVLKHINEEDILIIYTPHISNALECPYYIPKVASVGILFKKNELSVHYIPFLDSTTDTVELVHTLNDIQERIVRTSLRLLQTAYKHSKGCRNGYSPKMKHDVIINKIKFQKKYLELKQKYGSYLVENWMESTDPKKHAFEEIAIAAFLLELWDLKYKGLYLANNSNFEFRDLGCGNGVLTYILIMEGCKGHGIDARSRKTWTMFPPQVQKNLKQQVIIPSILLRPNIQMKFINPSLTDNNMIFQVKAQNDLISDKATILYSSKDLIESSKISIAEFTKKKHDLLENVFIIGNHSDELTCWIPLLGYPFMVIPCCSHNFNGDKHRYRIKGSSASASLSTYGSLVEKVMEISERAGWDPVEKEMLRIPSTRNAAIIGIHNKNFNGKLTQANWPNENVYNIIMENGGANGWVGNAMKLVTQK